MSAHVCPPCCHHCPDAEGAVIPGCMGTAALALHDGSFDWCTCEVDLPTEGTAEAQVALLTARVRELEDKLARLEAQQ